MIAEDYNISAAASRCICMTVELGKVYSCNVELRMFYFYFFVDILQKLHSKILKERNSLGIYVKIQGRLFCIDNGKETFTEVHK